LTGAGLKTTEKGATMRSPSAERWVAELDDILRRYDPGEREMVVQSGRLNREAAIDALRKLGFTTGEALRLLRSKAGAEKEPARRRR
jgi:hypothetical protein